MDAIGKNGLSLFQTSSGLAVFKIPKWG